MNQARPAIVLLSGGLDSATCLAIAKSEGFTPYCLSFDYGQRHKAELQAAARVAAVLGAKEHRVVRLDIGQFGGSALTDSSIAVPTEGVQPGIPVTYVPARNTVMLSFALAWAEVLGAKDIFVGVNAVDYSGYPDCRPEYIAAFERMANLGTKAGVEGDGFTVHTPLIRMTKKEIVAKGIELGVDFGMTVSCYDPTPGPAACGRCDACLLRLRAFEELGKKDPARYR
ncbi:MAG TPA: 7-cyano-7-deazaguanine synthase QueC [Azospira sp.]|nr:7-cyano-7-deazaguanine synthase QueC [Azospira sp.]